MHEKKDEVGNTGIQKFLRSEMSFYIGVAMVVLTAAASYYSMAGKFELLDQKLTFFITSFETNRATDVARTTALEQKVSTLEKDLIGMSSKISALETLSTFGKNLTSSQQ